jgi:hypothetical protein
MRKGSYDALDVTGSTLTHSFQPGHGGMSSLRFATATGDVKDLIFDDTTLAALSYAVERLAADREQSRRSAYPACKRCLADQKPGRIDGDPILHNHTLAVVPNA